MTELVVVGEGQTEERFVRQLLAPTLAELAVYATSRVLRTSRGAGGGALTTDRVLHQLPRILKERDDMYVATFFDLYGLAPDFPGLSATAGLSDPLERAAAVEAAFRDTVVAVTGCRPSRFVPHIQPYEFEALLLADPKAFARVNPQWQSAEGKLATIVGATSSPEHVNDGVNTHPSARIRQHLPGYRKVGHGVAVAAAIGLDRIRAECRHFAEWFGRMQALPPLGRAGP